MKNSVCKILMGMMVLSVVFSSILSANAATPINKIVVIGESSSDGGNAPTAVLSNYKYYLENNSVRNETVIASNGSEQAFYPNYKFCNGNVAVEQLASLYNINDTSHFFNLGYGGLQTHVMRQYKDYIHNKITSKLAIDNQTLVIIWMGGNNLLTEVDPNYAYDGIINASLTANKSKADIEASPPLAIKIGVDHINQEIVDLWGMGARHFVVIGMPDLAKFPKYYSQSASNKQTITALSDAWNTELSTRVTNINNWAINDGHSATNPILYIDFKQIFNVAYDYVNNPSNGFKVPNLTGIEVCDQNGFKSAAACPNSIKDYTLFWDGVHLTQAAHGYFASEIKSKMDNAGLQITPN